MNKGIFGGLLAIFAVLALAIAGCGGGDETTSLSRSQFVKQANANCEKQEERRANIIRKEITGRDQTKLLPLKDREQLVLKTVPPYEAMAAELESLGAPEGDEEKVEAIVEAMEKAAENVKDDPATALTSTSQFQGANQLAARYGLTGCVI